MNTLWVSRDKGKMWDKEVWFWKKKPDFEHGIFYLEDDTYQENSLDEFPYKYFQRIFGNLEPGECRQMIIEGQKVGRNEPCQLEIQDLQPTQVVFKNDWK